MSDRFHEEEHGIRRVDQGWILLRHINIPEVDEDTVDYHLLPVGDNGRHHLVIGCPCSPELIQILEDGLIYRHWAYDERDDNPDAIIKALSHLLP